MGTFGVLLFSSGKGKTKRARASEIRGLGFIGTTHRPSDFSKIACIGERGRSILGFVGGWPSNGTKCMIFYFREIEGTKNCLNDESAWEKVFFTRRTTSPRLLVAKKPPQIRGTK